MTVEQSWKKAEDKMGKWRLKERKADFIQMIKLLAVKDVFTR